MNNLFNQQGYGAVSKNFQIYKDENHRCSFTK